MCPSLWNWSNTLFYAACRVRIVTIAYAAPLFSSTVRNPPRIPERDWKSARNFPYSNLIRNPKARFQKKSCSSGLDRWNLYICISGNKQWCTKPPDVLVCPGQNKRLNQDRTCPGFYKMSHLYPKTQYSYKFLGPTLLIFCCATVCPTSLVFR